MRERVRERGSRAAIALALAALLGLSGCAGPPTDSASAPPLRGEWQLRSGHDKAGPLALERTLISLTIGGLASTSGGRAACSPYAARVTGSLGAVYVHVTRPALPACDDAVALELDGRYFAALERVTRADVEGTHLILTGPGIALDFITPLPVLLASAVGSTWVLLGLRSTAAGAGAPETPAAASPSILRFTAGLQLTGATDCRRFLATFRLDAGEIVTSALHLRPGCRSAQDATIVAALQGGFTIATGGALLTLTNARKQIVLRYYPTN